MLQAAFEESLPLTQPLNIKSAQILLSTYYYFCTQGTELTKTKDLVHSPSQNRHTLFMWGTNLTCPFSFLFYGVPQSSNCFLDPDPHWPLPSRSSWFEQTAEWALLYLLPFQTLFWLTLAFSDHSGDQEQLMASIKSSRYSLISAYQAKPSAWYTKLRVVKQTILSALSRWDIVPLSTREEAPREQWIMSDLFMLWSQTQHRLFVTRCVLHWNLFSSRWSQLSSITQLNSHTMHKVYLHVRNTTAAPNITELTSSTVPKIAQKEQKTSFDIYEPHILSRITCV